ncbi:MAG: GTP-binding protein [Pseudomonadota bacterium]
MSPTSRQTLSGDEVLPVHVLTGFLGSGKTTLLNRLLNEQRLRNSAVIINEFGEISIDHLLVEQSDDRLVELAGGCVCCAVRGDLSETLRELLARRDAGRCARFDRVIIETSGLADPMPIMNLVSTDLSLAPRLRHGRVVATVDAVSAAAEVNDPLLRYPEAARQVAFADDLVVTKADLAPLSATLLRERLAQRNDRATLREATEAGVGDPESLFAELDAPQPWLVHGDPASPAVSPAPAFGDGAADHPVVLAAHHHRGPQTFVLTRSTPVAGATLPLFVQTLAEQLGPALLRVKGLVWIEESPERPAVLHGIQHVFHPLDFLPEWPDGVQRTRLVFIVEASAGEWSHRLLDAIDREVRTMQRRLKKP